MWLKHLAILVIFSLWNCQAKSTSENIVERNENQSNEIEQVIQVYLSDELEIVSQVSEFINFDKIFQDKNSRCEFAGKVMNQALLSIYIIIEEIGEYQIKISDCSQFFHENVVLITLSPIYKNNLTQSVIGQLMDLASSFLSIDSLLLQEFKTSYHIKSIRKLQSSIQEFDSYANETSVLDAINIFYMDANQTLYDHMVYELSKYNSLDFGSSTECYMYSTAIENLMDPTLFPVQSNYSIDLLHSLSKFLYSSKIDYSSFTEITEKYLNIQVLFLYFYSKSMDSSSLEYFSLIKTIDNLIVEFLSNTTKGTTYTLYQSFESSSNINLDSSLVTVKYNKTLLNEIEGCFCSLCSNSIIVSVIETRYSHIFNDADGISLRVLEAGVYNASNYSITFYEIQNEINHVCLNVTRNLKVYSNQSDYGFSCRPGYFSCEISEGMQGSYDVKVDLNEIVTLFRNCANGCKLCKDGQDLCSSCLDGFYLNAHDCLMCELSCKTCENFNICKSCREHASGPDENNECTCILEYGYNPNDGHCIDCLSPYCYNCSSNFSKCDECIDGFFEYQDTCLQCLPECLTCNDNTSCVSCLSYLHKNENNRCFCEEFYGFNESAPICLPCQVKDCKQCYLDHLNCEKCSDGYYLSENNECLPCDFRCLTCSSFENCLSCKNNATINNQSMCECNDPLGFNSEGNCTSCTDLNCEVCDLNSSVCDVCIPGFYLEGYNCFPCNKSCKTCELGFNCSSCKENASGPNEFGQCECIDHFGFDNNYDCVGCKENCSLCWTNISICDECNEEFYENMGGCDPCHLSCQTCSNSSVCDTCKTNSSSLGNLCQCNLGYGRDPSNQCSICNESCYNCSENNQQCQECDDGYYLNSSQCYKCDKTCKTCTSEYECDSCWDNASLDGAFCKCNSGFGKNLSTGFCDPCPYDCDLCETDSTKCETCSAGLGLNISQCLNCSESCIYCFDNFSECTLCESHYYLNESVCYKCDPTCENCTNYDICSSCWPYASLGSNDSCVCDLGYGLNMGTGRCEECYSHCQVCTENKEVCSRCDDHYGIDPSTLQCLGCMDFCNNCSKNSSSCQECNVGYYFDGYSCVECLDICHSCSDGISCDSCWPNASIFNDSVCRCHDGLGFDLTDGHCQSCSENCSLCYYNFLTCSKCKEPYGLHPVSLICENCSSNCINCSENSLKCTECEEGFYLDNDVCLKCNNTCKTCLSLDICLSCWENATIDQSKCKCNIGLGINLESGLCLPCEEKCEECFENYQLCETCKNITSIGLNHDNFLCEECDINCLNCRYNRSECYLCKNHFYLESFGCHECYNTCGNCSQKEICLDCYDNAALLDSMCICDNFYGVNTTGFCDSCEDKLCKDCSLNSTICTSCKPNSSLLNNTCKCNMYYGESSNTCVSCEDIRCQLCTNSMHICDTCVENTKPDTFPCECISYSTYDATSHKCLCDLGYVLNNDACLVGYRYLRPSDVYKSEFDSNFLSISIYLNTEIDTSVSSLCSNIIKITSKLGTGAVCSFPNSTLIKISLGLAWTLTTNDVLELKSDYLKRTSGEFLLTYSDILVSPSYSAPPFSPTAHISGPSLLSLGCNSEEIQYNSYGSSGISSETFAYEWSASFDSSQTSTLSIFPLNSSKIPESSTSIFINLTVTDIFNNSDSTSITIPVESNKLLTLSLDTGNSLTVKPSSSFTIQASIKDRCGMDGSTVYTWSVMPNILSSCKKVSPSRLLVPAQLLLSSQSPYLFTVTATILGVSGSTSVQVSVSRSDLVLLWNRPTGDISSSIGFSAEASKSYDPDSQSAVLTCLWETSPASVLANVVSDSFAILIPGDNFQGLASFSVKVTVSDLSTLRSVSGSNSYNVLDDLNTVVKMIVPTTRVPVSKQFTLKTSITSTTGSSILWTQLSGPSVTIKPNNFPFISFNANTLKTGSSYVFQIAVTEKTGRFLRSYANITTNLSPSCLSSILFNPTSGITRKTSVRMSINNCRDLDGPDSPITFTFGYSLNGKDTNLGLPSKTNTINSIFPTGLLYPYVKVCDSIEDCTVYRSSEVLTIRVSRRYLKEQNSIQEYENDCNSFGVVNTLLVYLKSIQVSGELLERMVQDLESFVANETKSLQLLDLALEVIEEFLGTVQLESLDRKYLKRYYDLALLIINQINETNDDTSLKLVGIADRIIDIDSGKFHRKLVFGLLGEFLNIYKNIGEVFQMQTKNLIVYKTLNFEKNYAKRDLLFGSTHLKFPNLSFDAEQIVDFQFILINLTFPIFKFSIFTELVYEDYEIVQIEKTQLVLNYSALLKIPNRYDHLVKCREVKRSQIGCRVDLTKKKDIVYVKFEESGEYETYQFEGFHDRVALYFACSVLMLWLIFVIVFSHMESVREDEVNLIKANQIKNKSESELNPGLEESPRMIYEKTPLFSNHLILGIFSKRDKFLSRTKRISIYFSSLILLTGVQSYIHMSTTYNSMQIGAISSLITWPLSLLSFLTLSSRRATYSILGNLIIILSPALGLSLSFLFTSSETWYKALLTGFLIDILILQTASFFIIRYKSSKRIIEPN